MYRTVDTCLWTDPRVKPLAFEAKALFVYLITNPHSHLGGIYYLPVGLICLDTGLTEKGVRRGIDTLSRAELAKYDTATEVVWVVNMLRYQGRGQKIAKSCATQLASLHNSSLIAGFLKKYADYKIPFSIKSGRGIDRVSIGDAVSPSPDPDPVLSSPDDSSGEESAREGGAELAWFSTLDPFEIFWSVYPRKIAKDDARRAWSKRATDPDTFPELIAALRRAARTTQWLDQGGRFIPHASTWLNGRRWTDEVTDGNGPRTREGGARASQSTTAGQAGGAPGAGDGSAPDRYAGLERRAGGGAGAGGSAGG